jgi:hypothetical protein
MIADEFSPIIANKDLHEFFLLFRPRKVFLQCHSLLFCLSSLPFPTYQTMLLPFKKVPTNPILESSIMHAHFVVHLVSCATTPKKWSLNIFFLTHTALTSFSYILGLLLKSLLHSLLL